MAEVESGEVVGVVRGCIKTCAIGSHSGSLFKIGSILGLRVSPTYRYMYIFSTLNILDFFFMIHTSFSPL